MTRRIYASTAFPFLCFTFRCWSKHRSSSIEWVGDACAPEAQPHTRRVSEKSFAAVTPQRNRRSARIASGMKCAARIIDRAVLRDRWHLILYAHAENENNNTNVHIRETFRDARKSSEILPLCRKPILLFTQGRNLFRKAV